MLSQVGEGWQALPTLYDDGGFSGGTMERPALKALLADIGKGRIDVVVVYKVDRLTRSLADFAKIVEQFDKAGASFVSVTQAFNTTTSMGRLTLNVLLSFAQFEREVTGERIRDKIAASKKKGMWMGGTPPLGYDPPTDQTTRALVVNQAEAEQVRYIFDTYLAVGSVHALAKRLREEGIVSRRHIARNGHLRGGTPLQRGALYHLLRSPIYLGRIPHRDMSYPGAHPAIIERDVHDAVQAMLRPEAPRRPRLHPPFPLAGRISTGSGVRMGPISMTNRHARRYRYYQAKLSPEAREPDALNIVPADDVEQLISATLDRLGLTDGDLKRAHIHPYSLRLSLDVSELIGRDPSLQGLRHRLMEGETLDQDDANASLTLPIRMKTRGGRTWITRPQGSDPHVPARPDRALIKALRLAHQIARAHGLIGQAEHGDMRAPQIAHHRRLAELAFLSPELQKAILEGRQPRGLNLAHLLQTGIPADWDEQTRRFGGSA